MLLSVVEARTPQLARAFLANESEIAQTPIEFREALLALSQLRTYEANSTIVNADDTDGAIFAIVYGAVAFIPALGPADANLANILHPGDWFGYLPLIMNTPRNASLIARTQVVLAVITRNDLNGLLEKHPVWWRHIAALASQYGNKAANIAADLMIANSNRRCLSTLLRLAGCRFRTRQTRPPIAFVNQAELGAMANLSRNSVSRILHQMTRRNLISVGYMQITLLDPEALRTMVDDA